MSTSLFGRGSYPEVDWDRSSSMSAAVYIERETVNLSHHAGSPIAGCILTRGAPATWARVCVWQP